VRTQFGYHIIKVEEHSYTPFEQVKATIEKSERQARVQAALDAMKTSAKPTFNDSYFGTPAAPAPPATPAAGATKKQ
jgi:parvulin-like peptidyl-prolyl isomerase